MIKFKKSQLILTQILNDFSQMYPSWECTYSLKAQEEEFRHPPINNLSELSFNCLNFVAPQGLRNRTYLLEETISLGEQQGDIIISDGELSPLHAIFTTRGERIYLKCLSTGLTQVNERVLHSMEEVLLEVEDVITLGKIRILIDKKTGAEITANNLKIHCKNSQKIKELFDIKKKVEQYNQWKENQEVEQVKETLETQKFINSLPYYLQIFERQFSPFEERKGTKEKFKQWWNEFTHG